MESARTHSRSSESSTRTTHSRPAKYLICVSNQGYPSALEPWKLYRCLPDAAGAKRNWVRVVDESGEDYLFPAHLFAPIAVPKAVRDAMAS